MTYVILALLAVAIFFAVRRIRTKGTCNCGHCSDSKPEKR